MEYMDVNDVSGAEARLARAKRQAELETTTSRTRKWLVVHVDSYGDKYNRANFHILEGSPPRAYIIENPGRGVCVVLGMDGDVLGRVSGGEHERSIRWVPTRKARKNQGE